MRNPPIKTHPPGSEPVSRRTALTSVAVAAGAVFYPRLACSNPLPPVVETCSGKIRGSVEKDVHVFRGIPYAGSTAGANRYRPPNPPEPWAHIRDATHYGHSAPQVAVAASHRAAFAQINAIGEDCLTLNMFTPSASDGSLRPVMVWLHGGGWRTGAGSAPGLEGHALASEGDVVLVTVNHRLDTLGYLRIDDGDDRFADSGNLGVLDLIQCLRWVRDNIAAFGGDAGNVTIFGQSGGGAKVAALLAAAPARGLFHKAIAMSCSGCLQLTAEAEAATIAEILARSLGLPRLNGRTMQALPLEQIIKASKSSCRPVIDGRTFVRHPYDPDPSPTGAGIPLLIGNVANETRMTLAAAGMENFSLGEEEVLRRLSRFMGISPPRAARIFDAYRACYPSDGPGDLLGAITTDYIYIRNTHRMADLHATHAPVYSYMFMRRTPVMGGILRSAHECDVPFVFGTAEGAAEMVGRGRDIAPLTQLMIRTWTTFARTGNPGHSGLPQWPRHRAGAGTAMLLDVESSFGTVPGASTRTALDGLQWYEYSRPMNYATP